MAENLIIIISSSSWLLSIVPTVASTAASFRGTYKSDAGCNGQVDTRVAVLYTKRKRQLHAFQFKVFTTIANVSWLQQRWQQ